MPEIGETIYYRRDSREFVQKAIIYGETSRSWLIGQEKEWWNGDPESIQKYATKLPKKEIMFADAAAYELSLWASKNRWKIREQVNFASPEQLKKVAEVIGYTG